jgi:hypothetical protein
MPQIKFFLKWLIYGQKWVNKEKIILKNKKKNFIFYKIIKNQNFY